MVQNGLDQDTLIERAPDLSFPESVIGLLKGRLGRPPYGFPVELQQAVLRDEVPLDDRPGAYLDPVDFDALKTELRELSAGDPTGDDPTDRDVLSRILFPDVYREYVSHRTKYGGTWALDTPTFFYGLEPGERVSVDIEPGKTLMIRLISISDERPDGTRSVLFELNGHAREVRVRDTGASVPADVRVKADTTNWTEVGASMPGKVVQVLVAPGDSIHKGDQLLIAEAMKMETALVAPRAAIVEEVLVKQGDEVAAGDLLIRLAPVTETEEI